MVDYPGGRGGSRGGGRGAAGAGGAGGVRCGRDLSLVRVTRYPSVGGALEFTLRAGEVLRVRITRYSPIRMGSSEAGRGIGLSTASGFVVGRDGKLGKFPHPEGVEWGGGMRGREGGRSCQLSFGLPKFLCQTVGSFRRTTDMVWGLGFME